MTLEFPLKQASPLADVGLKTLDDERISPTPFAKKIHHVGGAWAEFFPGLIFENCVVQKCNSNTN